MDAQRMIELLNRIEHDACEIFVREQVNSKVGNYALTELPTDLAIQHTCRLIRTRLIQEEVSDKFNDHNR